MNGKKAKRMRQIAESIFVSSDVEKRNHGRIKVGRTHGGPAFGRFAYPPSMRWEKIGDFDVLVTDTDEIRKQAAQAVITEAP